MASYKEQGDSGLSETEADPSSHRARYTRRKTAHDKVCGVHSLASISVCAFYMCTWILHVQTRKCADILYTALMYNTCLVKFTYPIEECLQLNTVFRFTRGRSSW